MEAVALGFVVGLVAGILPGAFFMLVATTALERGVKQGVTVAFIPLATETVVFLATVLVLTRLPEEALRWVGLIGGLLLLYIAWRMARRAGKAEHDRKSDDPEKHVARVALFSVLEPAPWIFWFLVGGPLFLSRWYESGLQGILFVGSFMAVLVGVRACVAWAASHGRRLEPVWYRRALRGSGAALGVLGLLLLWQSWVGNFEKLILEPEQVEEEVIGQEVRAVTRDLVLRCERIAHGSEPISILRPGHERGLGRYRCRDGATPTMAPGAKLPGGAP